MIIVDGYNVIYKWKSLSNYISNMEIARTKLVNILANYQGYIEEEVVVVFDSAIREAPQRAEDTPQNIQVIYAPSSQGADIFIEHMVYTYTDPKDITVITADSLERMGVIKNGAKTVAPERFEKDVFEICGYGKEEVI